MVRYFLSCIICVAFIGPLSAQTAIDKNAFDEQFLNDLLLDEINRVRDSLKLGMLTSDPILFKAAQHQSEYLRETKKLSHFQPKEKYKNPASRVSSFKGSSSIVLENVLSCPALVPFKSKSEGNKVITIDTYEWLAKQMVKDWMNSPGHATNIKNSKVTSSGISAKFNPENSNVYVTQVFGLETINPQIEKELSHNIKDPGNAYMKVCGDCYNLLAQKPTDVQWGVTINEGMIYFYMNDPEWFNKLFPNKNDGVAVDIVSKNQYSCAKKSSHAHWLRRGLMLPPVLRKDFKEKIFNDQQGNVYLLMGALPAQVHQENSEFNFVFIIDGHACRYNIVYNITAHKWDLLEMGMFMDTLSNTSSGDGQDRFSMINKKLRFTIPFERNKTEYQSKDIKPLYDSLKLTNYTIKSIEIRAYSSVEGPTDHNVYLQEKRAKSIIEALQSLQLGKIDNVEISANENWVEFLEDVVGTQYDFLKEASKDQIKKYLENKTNHEQLEPYLSRHRKAIVFLELEVKNSVDLTDPTKAKEALNNAIRSKNISEALKIQQIIFANIRNNKLPHEVLDEVSIPHEIEYGLLINNQSIFKYQENEAELYTAIAQFVKLSQLMPNDANIKYNLCALRLKSWVLGKLASDPMELYKDIEDLEVRKIDTRLVNRLRINYNIILSEYLAFERKYAEKDKCIKQIQSMYKGITMTEKDVLNLAKYFAGYARYELATNVLAGYVKKVDINEDVLYYYINLTISDTKITSQQGYRTIMANAYNINPKRYCSLFESPSKGGITFQLLDDAYLRKSYCENCASMK